MGLAASYNSLPHPTWQWLSFNKEYTYAKLI